MAAYVDDAAIHWRGKDRFHLTADTREELHEFCSKVGIKRCWFHAVPGRWHYDVTEPQRQAAIEAGAMPVTARQMVYLTEQGRRRLPQAIERATGDPFQLEWLQGIQQLLDSGTKAQDAPPAPVQIGLL